MRRILAIAILLVAVMPLQAEGEVTKPKRAALPVLLNIIPGLGIGSFVQGDILGGLVGLGGEVTGIGLASYGMVYGYVNIIGVIFESMMGEYNGTSKEGVQTGMYLALGGVIVWTGTKIFEIVRPISYARDYNKKKGLSRIWLSPVLSPTGNFGGGAMNQGLALTFAY
jgi:hypothetical protein